MVIVGRAARNDLVALLEDDLDLLVDQSVAICHKICNQVRAVDISIVPLGKGLLQRGLFDRLSSRIRLLLHLRWFRDLTVYLREELAFKYDILGQNKHTFQSFFDQAKLISFLVSWATETDTTA